MSASTALAIPAIVFALNAIVSFRERGQVEPLDIPAAVAFAASSAVVLRGSRLALLCGIALAAAYLVTAAAGGIMPFVGYWAVALLLTVQALPVTELRAGSAA